MTAPRSQGYLTAAFSGIGTPPTIFPSHFQDLAASAVPDGLMVTSGASASPTATQTMIAVNKTVGSATTIQLPDTPVPWRRYTVMDVKGDAATNPITVQATGTIDGAAGFLIHSNHGSADFISYDGTNYKAI